MVAALGCAQQDTRVPRTQDRNSIEEPANFCTIDIQAPEAWSAVLSANDVRGVDCVPPDRGEVFSLGFSHAGWWLQLDIARPTVVVGRAHAFDGQAALLALDCWEWDGAVTVEADDDAGWAVRIDARCRDDAHKAVVAAFSGEW